ncbi:hypothetical protein [Micromonospora sp. NPDC000018]|uniref:tetratricopeptide repeat protein n=1 Tax=Micromonospora sp. NPDC000018 TaxID=3154239 RepID=UPI003332FFCC
MSQLLSAAERFATALRELYEAAGSPEYRVVVRQGSQQPSPVKLTDSSLSDWLGGKSVPADPSAVRFLVPFLQGWAAKQQGYPTRPLDWWLTLRQQAWAEKRTNRGGRPAASTGTSSGRSPRLGAPIGHYTPLMLEVHRAIDVPGHGGRLSLLPPYVSRAHDAQLRQVVDAAAGGASRMAVLVGGSSTGKTRACWETIQSLPDRWWLWHPIDPSRPDAAARNLDKVGPHTVVWLNEAQHYLLAPDRGVGERIRAGLRSLLRDSARGPVLILGTIWPKYWTTLTAPPPAAEDEPYPQARDLLAETVEIPVPDTFRATDLRALRAAADGDPRLRHAAEHAQAGRITQHLAGVPELLRRYRNAPPAARAIIDVAIDARRLGNALEIPHALLEQAAPGYMNDTDWDQAGDDWLEQALAYTARPCHGVPGPLTRIRPRPGDSSFSGGQPHYRLADYLEQAGRSERAGAFPPAAFWIAAAGTVTNPNVLFHLGQQAEQRGRYHRATQLYQQAVHRGRVDALSNLAKLREKAGDHAGAEALAMQAAERGYTRALRDLAYLREAAGDYDGALTMYEHAAGHGDRKAVWPVVELHELLSGRHPTDAGEAADRGDTGTLSALARWREEAGDHAGALTMYEQAAGHGDTDALRYLAYLREQAGDHAGAEAAVVQAADHGVGGALRCLAYLREQAGDYASADEIRKFGLDDDGSPAGPAFG